MPRIIVDWLEGRSEEVRNEIAKQITNAFVENANVRPDQVSICFKDNSPKLMYKAGKQYAEIEL